MKVTLSASSSRRWLLIGSTCGVFAFAACLVLMAFRGGGDAIGPGGSQSKSARNCDCPTSPSPSRVLRLLGLVPVKEDPASQADKALEASASSASVYQTPSIDCNRALSDLVQQNQSGISWHGYYLSTHCLQLLLDGEVRFLTEATRIRMLSQSIGPWETRHCFRRTIMESEKGPIRSRLAMVKAEFDRAQVPLILDHGTLVGSYRHHGFVPWDDDFDFRIGDSHMKAAHEIFSNLAKRNPKLFKFWPEASSTHWKFYLLDLRLQKAEVANFLLCLDIFFYYDTDPGSPMFNLTDRWSLTRKDLYFPLTQRPYEGMWFHAPRDTFGYLSEVYGGVSNYCYYHSYSNLDSVYNCTSRRSWTPCNSLRSAYPFVRRMFVGDTGASLEFLLLNQYLLQTVFLPGVINTK